MRTAIVTPGFSRDDQDWCIPALQDIATGLNARHDMHVCATSYSFKSRQYEVKGVPVKSVDDAAALAKRIAILAMDAELRQSMSEAAFNKATTVFTVDQSVYALEDLYAQTIAKVAGSR